MSYDAYAMLVVGFEATESDFEVITKKPGCEHVHRSKFCPECGAPKTIEETTEIEGWDGDQYMGFDSFRTNCEPDSPLIIGIEIESIASGQGGGYSALDEFKKEIGEAIIKISTTVNRGPMVGRPIKTWLMLRESY